MKHAFLALICSVLVCHGEGFFTGAQWLTKAPIPAQKYAGAIEILFYGDNTMDIDFYWPAGQYVDTAEGSYHTNLRGDFVFTVTDSDGWIYTGVYNKAKDLIVGTMKSPLALSKGKFQLTFVETPPGDEKSQGDKSRLSVKRE